MFFLWLVVNWCTPGQHQHTIPSWREVLYDNVGSASHVTGVWHLGFVVSSGSYSFGQDFLCWVQGHCGELKVSLSLYLCVCVCARPCLLSAWEKEQMAGEDSTVIKEELLENNGTATAAVPSGLFHPSIYLYVRLSIHPSISNVEWPFLWASVKVGRVFVATWAGSQARSNMSPDEFLAAPGSLAWLPSLTGECQLCRSAAPPAASARRGQQPPAFPWQRGKHEQLKTLKQVKNETSGFAVYGPSGADLTFFCSCSLF